MFTFCYIVLNFVDNENFSVLNEKDGKPYGLPSKKKKLKKFFLLKNKILFIKFYNFILFHFVLFYFILFASDLHCIILCACIAHYIYCTTLRNALFMRMQCVRIKSALRNTINLQGYYFSFLNLFLYQILKEFCYQITLLILFAKQ